MIAKSLMALRSQFGKDGAIIWNIPSFQANSPSGGLLERIKVEATHRYDALRPIWLECAHLGHGQESNSGVFELTSSPHVCSPCICTNFISFSSFIITFLPCLQMWILRLRNMQSVSGRAGIKTYFFLTRKLFSSVPYHFLWLVNVIFEGWVIWESSAILFSTTSIDFPWKLHFLEGYALHSVVSNSFEHNAPNSFVYSNNIYQTFNMYHVLYRVLCIE